jgi:predicted hydrocarbon binding protein
MTNDEIRELAQEAGFRWGFIKAEGLMDGMIDFAKLVAQHEREWVKLDEEDYIKAYELCDFDKVAAFEFFESKLKEKNS